MFADGATPYGDHAPGGFVCSEERGGCLGVECSARVQNRRPGKPAAERRSPRPKTQWKIRGENPGLDGKPWIEKAIRSGGRGMEVALTNRRGGGVGLYSTFTTLVASGPDEAESDLASVAPH